MRSRKGFFSRLFSRKSVDDSGISSSKPVKTLRRARSLGSFKPPNPQKYARRPVRPLYKDGGVPITNKDIVVLQDPKGRRLNYGYAEQDLYFTEVLSNLKDIVPPTVPPKGKKHARNAKPVFSKPGSKYGDSQGRGPPSYNDPKLAPFPECGPRELDFAPPRSSSSTIIGSHTESTSPKIPAQTRLIIGAPKRMRSNPTRASHLRHEVHHYANSPLTEIGQSDRGSYTNGGKFGQSNNAVRDVKVVNQTDRHISIHTNIIRPSASNRFSTATTTASVYSQASAATYSPPPPLPSLPQVYRSTSTTTPAKATGGINVPQNAHELYDAYRPPKANAHLSVASSKSGWTIAQNTYMEPLIPVPPLPQLGRPSPLKVRNRKDSDKTRQSDGSSTTGGHSTSGHGSSSAVDSEHVDRDRWVRDENYPPSSSSTNYPSNAQHQSTPSRYRVASTSSGRRDNYGPAAGAHRLYECPSGKELLGVGL